MGRLDVNKFKYLSNKDFRVLTAVEMGMKNHELVPHRIVSSIASLRSGGCFKVLSSLLKERLVCYEKGPSYDGYRLTNSGYDYLALHYFEKNNTLGMFGSRFGVGKESDIFSVSDSEGKVCVMKIHRLGRTSFRNIKAKRDYHQHRNSSSWIYLSRLSAAKEYNYMKVLYENDFPVPKPIDCNRHCVVMDFIEGEVFSQVSSLDDAESLYNELMELLVRLGNNGLIHSDFNEFNIMITSDEHAILIDFPQMVSTHHENAEFYFNRDVECIKTFFQRRFQFEAANWPVFSDLKVENHLDLLSTASGFSKELFKALKKDLRRKNQENEVDSNSEDDDAQLENDYQSEEEADPSLENDCQSDEETDHSVEKEPQSDLEEESSQSEYESCDEQQSQKEKSVLKKNQVDLKDKTDSETESSEEVEEEQSKSNEKQTQSPTTKNTKKTNSEMEAQPENLETKVRTWVKKANFKERQKQVRHRKYVKGEASVKTRKKRDANNMIKDTFLH